MADTADPAGMADLANPWTAWPAGVDPKALSRKLSRAHDEFVSSGLTGSPVRTVVADSWRRCVELGLDPEHTMAPLLLLADDLEATRADHPLSAVMPLIRRLLVDDAAQDGLLVAVSDAAGRLLWVEGEHRLRAQAEGMHFVAGASWAERDAGTNAPGTALAIDHSVQIFAAEHLSRDVVPWSCSAAPIHDPDTGAILGVLDLTGGDDVAAPRALSLVKATVAAAEGELKLLRLGRLAGDQARSSGSRSAAYSRLDVLGVHTGTLRHPTGTTRLSLRHSEILLLLSQADDGLTADEVAVQLHARESAPVTVRAELSRLRQVLGGLHMKSRPYRLPDGLRTDADLVREHLRNGQPGAAVAAYRGPVLPASEAPGIVQLRQDLHSEVRSALLAAGDPDALLRMADTPHGRLDFELWATALDTLPAGSPRRAQIRAHLSRLTDELR
jgi:transcriptional regulator of acetoin/glycerol metabolism